MQLNVSLCDVDGHHFPNLALMKLSAWHKAQGDTVEWYEPLLSNPDRIYASKVFTFSADAQRSLGTASTLRMRAGCEGGGQGSIDFQ